ncbi:MAG TPA: cob(I)yrinic acid a,c-diamide adenosyltransferase [Clostridiales bacterium]|nr:cob(I)yrinic acid a,c-diamide adenosyltransferase [Clostridiales bacterium]
MTDRPERGLLMVLTGNGKGKTTAAFGQALRAIGHGARVLVIQFMKGSDTYGELKAARKYLDGLLVVEQYGLDRFVDKDNPRPEDLELARRGLERAREVLTGGEFPLVILDEINVALDFGLLPLEEVLEVLSARHPSVDVLLTGRYAPPAIVQEADLVSEVLDIKHHYAQGTPGRRGIEF